MNNIDVERDPDYEEIHVNQQDNHLTAIKNDAKEATIKKIQAVINSQFDKEIELKEEELNLIEKNIQEAHFLLDHLRTCIVSKFYLGEKIDPNHTPNLTNQSEQESWIHPTTKRYLGKASCGSDIEVLNLDHDYSMVKMEPMEVEPEKDKTMTPILTEMEDLSANTQKVKKTITIVVGNISKYIPPIEQSQNDQTTHKWMVYIRLKNEKLDVKSIVKKVIVFLHPSYKPNDLVELRDPPFYLCRRGWGEFPVRIQIHFQDTQNKPVDIIHNLKLDQTFTGLQTMGGETIEGVSLYLTEKVPKKSGSKISATPVTNPEQDVTIAIKTPTSAVNMTGDMITTEIQIKEDLPAITKVKEEPETKPEPSVNKPKATIPEIVSLPKKKFEMAYKVVVVKDEASPNRIKYYLYPNNPGPSKAVSVLKKPITPTTNNPVLNTKANESNVFVLSWKAKENDHKKWVKERFVNRLTDYENMNDFMLDLVKFFPLCCAKPNYPYCAQTWEIFNSWNVGKQRAAEWLRAKTIERLMDDILKSYDKLWAKEIWCTKRILQWCRATGYIPPFYEPIQAAIKPITLDTLNNCVEAPLLNALEIVAELEEKTIKTPETTEDDVEIDITDETEVNPKKRLKQDNECKLMKELLLDKSIEEPEEIREIYISVCKAFMVDIVRCALLKGAETHKGKLYPNEVTIDNVYQAIISQPKFDILTNKYLGIAHEID